MIDAFVLLTPVLLIGVIALLAFVGCNQVFGLQQTELEVTVDSVNPQSGATEGGTHVRITGSAFATGATVTFGGVAATQVDVSGAVINANTPPHSSGAVDLVVTNPDGNSGRLPSTDPNHFSYAAVTNVQSLIVPGANNPAGATAQASVAFSGSAKVVMVTVLWPTGGGTLATPAITGGVLQSLKNDLWSGYNVQTFFAANVPAGPNVTVTATLSSPSTPSPWNLCVTVFDNADQANPTYAPNSASSTTSGVITPISINAFDASDLIYAVAIAQTSGGSFAITGTLSPGPGFTPEQSNGYLLIEDQQTTAAGPVSVSAGTSGTNAGRWYLVAVGIHHL